MEPKVFLSYASEDVDWKTNFADRRWFGDRLGYVRVIDYQMGDNIAFGHIDEWLREELQSSAAIVAIISEHYIAKRYTLVEWWSSLSVAQHQKIVVVPVLIDASAKTWWATQKKQGKFHILGNDYAYSDFSDGSGRRCQIITVQGIIENVTHRISELARLIRADMGDRERAAEPDSKNGQHSHGDGAQRGHSGDFAPDDPRAKANGQGGHNAATASSNDHNSRVETNPQGANYEQSIVVLGHPTAVSTPTLASNASDLCEELRAAQLHVIHWGDGWRVDQASRPGPATVVEQQPTFVFPLGPAEAGELARKQDLTADWLKEVTSPEDAPSKTVMSDCKIVLWLPRGLKDQKFETASAQSLDSDNPALRNDSPKELSEWIVNRAKVGLRAVTVLTLEELIDVDARPRLKAALHDGFHKLVGEVIQPAPEKWVFFGAMLVEQLRTISSERIIVAIHDLNTGIAKESKAARRELEQKLSSVSDAVGQATKLAKRTDLRLFRTALLVSKADHLPWVKYPSPSRFDDWCLLPFTETDDVLQPKPDHARVFRTYLQDWLS